MSKPQRIPRPRHLFPELAGFLIEWKRSNLRAGRQLRRAIGHVPIWVTGSLAGVLGIMLAVSLFFVHEPQLQAAAELPLPPPLPQFEPQPTLAVHAPRGRSSLLARIVHTYFPFEWDENRVVEKRSSAPAPFKFENNPTNDLWRSTRLHESTASPFAAYFNRTAGVQSHWPALVASDTPPMPFTSPSTLAMGVLVEKSADLRGSPHEPLTYEIVIRNTSAFMIENLSIRERISSLARVTEVIPQAGISGDELVWNLDLLAAGAARTFLVTLVPETEGQIETVTRIIPTSRVGATVQVRNAPTPVREQPQPVVPIEPAQPEPLIQVVPGSPELKLTYTEVKPLKQGDTLSMIFAVTNVGTAVAPDVQLFVRLSGEFEHRYGEFVKHQVGALAPGQTRRALLQATARDPGNARVDASLTMQGAEKQARELKIPIQSGPPQTGRQQPVVNRPVLDPGTHLTVLE